MANNSVPLDYETESACQSGLFLTNLLLKMNEKNQKGNSSRDFADSYPDGAGRGSNSKTSEGHSSFPWIIEAIKTI